MKKILIIALMLAWGCAAHAAITVTNLTVAQRPGTKLVDISYDLLSDATNAVPVTLGVMNGATNLVCTTVTGDVGVSVLPGTGKQMVWNMATDWNTNAATLSFSVQVALPDAPVPKSGQTVSYRTGDDGDLEAGVAWPNPRFTDQGDGTVTDNLTGLVWVKAPHGLGGNSGSMAWNSAVDFCANLTYAGKSDWRLPSRKELMSLVDYGLFSPALPSGHPFSGVQSYYYWSGTSNARSTDYAWYVNMDYGYVDYYAKAYIFYVWPVRGGQ